MLDLSDGHHLEPFLMAHVGNIQGCQGVIGENDQLGAIRGPKERPPRHERRQGAFQPAEIENLAPIGAILHVLPPRWNGYSAETCRAAALTHEAP